MDKKTLIFVGLCPNIHNVLFGEHNPYRRNTLSLFQGESFGTNKGVIVNFCKIAKYGSYGFKFPLYSYIVPYNDEVVCEKQVLRFNSTRTHAFAFLDLVRQDDGSAYGVWTDEEKDRLVLSWQAER